MFIVATQVAVNVQIDIGAQSVQINTVCAIAAMNATPASAVSTTGISRVRIRGIICRVGAVVVGVAVEVIIGCIGMVGVRIVRVCKCVVGGGGVAVSMCMTVVVL